MQRLKDLKPAGAIILCQARRRKRHLEFTVSDEWTFDICVWVYRSTYDLIKV